MTQNQFSAALAERLNQGLGPDDGQAYTKREIEQVLDALADQIQETVKKEGKCVVRGIGRFTLVARKARMGRNPQTGEAIKIKASKKLRVTVAKPLRDALGSK